MGTPGTSTATPPPKGRLLFGGCVFVLGQLSPLLVPLVVNSDLPTGWKTALSGLLMLGVPELALLAAVTILGKQGYDYLKGLILRFLKRHVVPREVSPARYRIGLVLFLIPILWGWLSPYLVHLVGGLEQNHPATSTLPAGRPACRAGRLEFKGSVLGRPVDVFSQIRRPTRDFGFINAVGKG